MDNRSAITERIVRELGEAQSNDEVLHIIEGLEREYALTNVVVTPTEWADLSNQVAKAMSRIRKASQCTTSMCNSSVEF